MTFLNFTIPSWSPLIAYNSGGKGAWLEVPTNDTSGTPSQDLISFAATAAGPHANATFNFTGTRITIFGSKGPLSGDFIVQLDDGPAMTENAHADGLSQAPLWSAQDLNNSEHTFKVTNNHSPQGFDFVLDFITVGRELGPPGYTDPIFNATFDDTSSSIVYNGLWTSTTSSSGFNNTLHSTTEEGSTLSLHFRGSSIELYGINADAEYEVQVDNQVTSIGPGKNTVFFSQDHQTPRTVLFYMDGLDENSTHVVMLANSNSDTNNPLYFDYAIVRSSQNSIETTPPNPKSHSTTPIVIGSVVGGVGLMIICLIVIVFLRHKHKSRRRKLISIIGTEPDERGITLADEVTPYLHNISKPTITQVSASQSVGGLPLDFQVPTLFTEPEAVKHSCRLVSVNDTRMDVSQLDPSQESLESQISTIRETDAGGVVINRLPPTYDLNWRGATST